MSESEKRTKENVYGSWEDILPENGELAGWQQSAFHAALEKLQTGHRNPDVVMQMGEAFGRGLFAQRIKDKSPDWTMKQWLQRMEKDIWGPLGDEFTTVPQCVPTGRTCDQRTEKPCNT